MYIIQLLFIQYDKSGYKNRYSRQGGETQNCRNYYYFCCEAKGSVSYTIWYSQKPYKDFESRGAKDFSKLHFTILIQECFSYSRL